MTQAKENTNQLSYLPNIPPAIYLLVCVMSSRYIQGHVCI